MTGRLPEKTPELQRELVVSDDVYPVLGLSGGVCVARRRRSERIAVAFDLFTGEELWTFDTGANGLALDAAPLPGGAFAIARARGTALEICRVSPDGLAERITTLEGRNPWNETVRVFASPAGAVGAATTRHTHMPGGGTYEGRAAGFAGEVLLVELPRTQSQDRSLVSSANGRGWGTSVVEEERIALCGDRACLIRSDRERIQVRAMDAATGHIAWVWPSPHPIRRYFAMPFALFLTLEPRDTPIDAPARLATLQRDGTLAAPPAPLAAAGVEVVAADATRIAWLTPTDRPLDERLTCARIAEPGAALWSLALPRDLSSHDPRVLAPDGRPPILTSDAGLVAVCNGRLAIYA